MYIIPAIDILNKKVVRLREGDYNQVTEYDVTLEEMIEKYQSNGTNFIHVIDYSLLYSFRIFTHIKWIDHFISSQIISDF